MSIKESHQVKVLETKKLLTEIINQPLNYNESEEITLALKSQGGLAKYTDVRQGILSCSLNTLKGVSESLLDRGFGELDQLRLNAKRAIEAATENTKEHKSSRLGLLSRAKNLEEQLEGMQKCNFQLTVIISELRSELKRFAYAKEESAEQKKLKYEELNKIVEAKLSFIFNGES